MTPNPMTQPWCCISCRAKFTFGELRCAVERFVRCPNCRSIDVCPADGGTLEPGHYHGAVGTVN